MAKEIDDWDNIGEVGVVSMVGGVVVGMEGGEGMIGDGMGGVRTGRSVFTGKEGEECD